MCNWTKWPMSLVSKAVDEITMNENNLNKDYLEAESNYCGCLYKIASDGTPLAYRFEFCLNEIMTFESSIEFCCALRDYYNRIKIDEDEIFEHIDFSSIKSEEYSELKNNLLSVTMEGRNLYKDDKLKMFNDMVKYSDTMRKHHILVMYRRTVDAIKELKKREPLCNENVEYT